MQAYNEGVSLWIDYPCNECDAQAGERCVYMNTGVNRTKRIVGLPTRKPHHDRSNFAWYITQKIIADKEKDRLSEWLRIYGDIFTELV
jgi:hypothetical protein